MADKTDADQKDEKTEQPQVAPESKLVKVMFNGTVQGTNHCKGDVILANPDNPDVKRLAALPIDKRADPPVYYLSILSDEKVGELQGPDGPLYRWMGLHNPLGTHNPKPLLS